MKKNRMMRLASILLVCVLLTTSVISGTFAKYTSTTSIEATSARVAKWSFELEGDDISDGKVADTIKFDLFSTILDTKTDADETDVDGDLIAPGTYGKFTIDVANKSEVNATYSLALTATVGTLPIEFSTDGTTWKTNIAELNVTDKAIDMKTGTDSVTVQWRWAFEGKDSQNFTGTQTDVTDTALGIAASGTIYVKATVTATQVD